MMAEERGAVRSVAWLQVFPALHILSAVRMALHFKSLLLAAIAISGMVAGWRVLDGLFSEQATPIAAAQLEHELAWPWVRSTDQLAESMTGSAVQRFTTLTTWTAGNPLVVAWNEISLPFRRMFQWLEAPTFTQFMYLLCCGLWALLVWSFFGGCISRQAAVTFARQENVSLFGLFTFVNTRLPGYFVAPLFPMLGVGLVTLLMAGAGALLRGDAGVAVVGTVLWPLVLFGGFVSAFLLLGLFFGFPLMWAAVSAEGTDAFGALSHAYAYVYQRPLRYLGYAVLAALAGVLGLYLVLLFGYWILELAHWGVSWGSGSQRLAQIHGPETAGRLVDTGALFIQFWTNCLMAIVYGFIFSYFWTATTVIYFLLRRLVDATEIDEVYMPGDQTKHGLPPLKTGPDGVPEVAEEPSEAT